MDTSDHTYSVLSGSLAPNESTCPEMREFDHVITTFMREQNIPGASVAISKHGELVYKQGYGISGPGRRVKSDSLFRIASISKSLTAICVLKLCEDGKLDLDALVFGKKGILGNFSPTSKGDSRIRRITVCHLLQHSAGWDRNTAGDPVFWNLEKVTGCPGPVTNTQLIKYMMTKKLQFSPGRRHAYSNFGYLVLGSVIEAVTGKSCDEYVPLFFLERGIGPMYVGTEKKMVRDSENKMATSFKKMVTGSEKKMVTDWKKEMAADWDVEMLTDCDKKTEKDSEEVEYFNNRQPSVAPSVFADEGLVAPQYGSFQMATTASYGGLVTSAPVLVTIADSVSPMAERPILCDAWIKTMRARPSYENETERCWYGLGWDIQDEGNTWGHTGAMEGTSCTLMRHESGLTWAVLLNAWAKDMDIDGMVKYALSSVAAWPLHQRWNKMGFSAPLEIISADSEEIVRVQVPLSEVEGHKLRMKLLRYKPRHMNAHFHSNEVFFNFVWRKSDMEWYLLIHLASKELPSKISQGKQQGYLINLLEAYDFHGKTFFAVSFERNPLESCKMQISYCDKPASEHEVLRKRYQGDGFLLVIQSVISRNRLPIVAAVYNKLPADPDICDSQTESHKPAQVTYFRIKLPHFCHELGRFSTKVGNYELKYLKFYDDVDDVSISAIWTSMKGDNKRHLYYRRYDVSLYGFLYEIRESSAKNTRVQFLCSYCNEGVVNFSAVWEAEL